MQNREPPAFQEYPAAMMAKREYRLMTATERGVLYSMRLECWVNKTVSAEPGALAKILGLDCGDVTNALPTVLPFFDQLGGELVCQEHEAYRAHLAERRLRQSQGGKTGASLTNDKRKKPRRVKNGADQATPADAATSTATSTSTPSSTSTASPRLLSTEQQSTAKSKPPPVKDLGTADPWVAQYAAAERVPARRTVKV